MKVIVTGASKGIGRGIASYLAMDGFDVGLLARSADLLADLRESLAEQGAACRTSPCDLRDYAATERAIGELADGLGGIDALINNAGLVIRKSVWDVSVEEWHTLIDTNLTGAFHATRAVLPYLREAGRGHIVNISSISGKVPLPGGSAYAASKFGLTGFSQSLLHEVRDEGIKVTTVYPGSVDTASHRRDELDRSWKVQPEEVGQACAHVLRGDPRTVVSEVEIRPLGRPPQD